MSIGNVVAKICSALALPSVAMLAEMCMSMNLTTLKQGYVQ
jgi:hypothetical protein